MILVRAHSFASRSDSISTNSADRFNKKLRLNKTDNNKQPFLSVKNNIYNLCCVSLRQVYEHINATEYMSVP